MLLRYLETAFLKKATKTKEPNGTYIETLKDVRTFRIQTKELNDEISATVYGANVYKMIRIKSVRSELEDYLYEKANNKLDNVSNYYIVINKRKYKIVSVNPQGVDLELI